MTLLDLCHELGLYPKKVSASNGGHYQSPCPDCGGEDRFYMEPHWGERGRYKCNRCGKQGDAIQFCRDFVGLSYREACEKLSCNLQDRGAGTPSKRELSKISKQPKELWEEKGTVFADACYAALMNDPALLNQLKRERSLTEETMRAYRLGWNAKDIWADRAAWGGAGNKKLFLPKGWVIPFYVNGTVQRIRIRKAEWQEGDKFGKYHEVSGGSDFPLICGFRVNETVVIVEAEFDAMLIRQEIGEFATCMATCGTTRKPNAETDWWLKSRKRILLAFDWDEAGKKAACDWRKAYPNARYWPSASGKSVADAFLQEGFGIFEWYRESLLEYDEHLQC